MASMTRTGQTLSHRTKRTGSKDPCPVCPSWMARICPFCPVNQTAPALWHNAPMAHASLTPFDLLEDEAVEFARKLVQRGECSDCVCRALAFAAMGLAYDTDNVASLRNTMAALLRASEQDKTTAATVPRH